MSARADLCGGRSVMIVPTATSFTFVHCKREVTLWSRAGQAASADRLTASQTSDLSVRSANTRRGAFNEISNDKR
jgi:hypothetical protein